MGTGDCLLVYDGQNSTVEPAVFTVYMKRPSSDRKHSQCDIETVQLRSQTNLAIWWGGKLLLLALV